MEQQQEYYIACEYSSGFVCIKARNSTFLVNCPNGQTATKIINELNKQETKNTELQNQILKPKRKIKKRLKSSQIFLQK